MFAVLTISLLILQSCFAVIIRPDSNDEYVSVTLPNADNSIDGTNNEWNMKLPINAWGLSMRLNGEKYSFQPGVTSRISIELEAECLGECNFFYAFSIGDIKYLTFMHNYDEGELYGTDGVGGGIFSYPACNDNNPLQSGDPSQLLDDANNDWNQLRTVMAGGQNVDLFNTQKIIRNKPIKFEFINNDIDDTFTVRFYCTDSSCPDDYQKGVDCVYQGAAPKCLDFIWYQTPDALDASTPQRIKSFKIESTNTGWTDDCRDPLVDSGPSCVAKDELSSVEFTLDSEQHQGSTEQHQGLIYFNNEIYGCQFTPNTDRFSCALDCSGASYQCAQLSLLGVDCNNAPSIKVAITNKNADYAVFASIRVITASKTYYGANGFCGTGKPFPFEIDGIIYDQFVIPGNTICGLGLLSNYKAICVSNGEECSPSTLVIELDSNKINIDIDYALIVDDSNLNKSPYSNCNNDEICCNSNDCADTSYCNPMGKCEEKPVCPDGSKQVGLHNANIEGCGLESCADRYNKATIEECEAHCIATQECKGYIFVPLDGDKNNPGKTVCSIYDSDIATGSYDSDITNQIFCTPTCDNINCDDNNVCTQDSCNYARCSNININGENDGCDEGNKCTQNICVDGECTNPATSIAIDCELNDKDNKCDGKHFCNKETGTCDIKEGTQIICQEPDSQCLEAGKCDPTTGKCSQPTPTETAANCGDGNMCNGAEICNDGTGECVKGIRVECPFGEKCIKTNGQCIPDCGLLDIDGFLDECSSLYHDLQKDLDKIRKDIDKNGENSDKNKDKIGKNKDDILVNKININDAIRDIKQNNKNIEKNKKDIDEIKNKMKENMNIIYQKIEKINQRINNLIVNDGPQRRDNKRAYNINKGGGQQRESVILSGDLNYYFIIIITLLFLINLIMIICYCCHKRKNTLKYAAIDTMYSSEDEKKPINKL